MLPDSRKQEDVVQDAQSQLQRHLIRALARTPRWLLHALAEDGCATAEGAREEVVNRILRALEPWELRPRRVCPYTGRVLIDADQRSLPLEAVPGNGRSGGDSPCNMA